jgi:predicted transcriptional regulator of viral defense system
VRSKYATVLGLRFRLVRIDSEDRVRTTDLEWRGPEKVRVSGRERTIVDGLNDPSWLGGWRHLIDIVDRYFSEEPNRKHLESELSRHGRGAAHKRLGSLLEERRPDEVGLIESAMKGVTKGVVKLDPSLPRKGSIDTRWGLLVNTRSSPGRDA